MTMNITIDAEAVRELFPEGSEARLQLSQAVIADYASKVLPKCFDNQLRIEIAKKVEASLDALAPCNKEPKAGIDEEVEVTFDGVANCSINAGRAYDVNLDISFETEAEYLRNFKAMAENISDETLIAILKERNHPYPKGLVDMVRNYSTKAVELALKELEKEIQQEQEKSFAEFIEQHSAD